MVESDLLRNSAADHHGEHHGATVHDIHSDDGNIHLPESTHEGDEHDVHHEGNQPTERKDVMRNRISRTVTSLALSTVFVLGLSANANLRAADLDLNNLQTNNLNDLGLNNLGLNNLQAANLDLNNVSLNNLRQNNAQATNFNQNDLNLNNLDTASLNLNNLNPNDLNLNGLGLRDSVTLERV